MRSKELSLVQENHATVKPGSSVTPRFTPRGMETYSESRIELQNLQIFWQSQVNFYHQSSPVNLKAWTLHWILQELKNTLEKLVVAVNLEAFWFEFWMKGSLVTEGNFVFCGWRFSNQFDVVTETHFSCNTIGRELWLALLCSLLCPEMDWNIRIGMFFWVC